ncbi:Uma2 family endonuclease [Planktothrix mougeotii]|uniref:Uma2 family endonuclease n=1 Tax=Planktothrix mougeotii LEGE 06226 TaxID=1828728 RepID=A0ABR9UAD8_9CYAN|nr:Uma2 family endonuclease [Planktothrix mougeotii]MBE9143423.1 Uma2 family endonuclease [Planktothrix mougeotii LEGE 06226]
MTTLVSIPELTQTPQWQPATWEDYLGYVNNRSLETVNITFDQGYLWIDMGNEGINHSNVNDLLSFLFYVWFSRQPGVLANSFSGCVIEKPNQRAASPDKVLYIGENSPKWQEGEPRRINLEQWRVPDLVGEISDTTLAMDLDEKKQLYAALGISEYWVIDIRGKRAIAFRLQDNGKYQEINTSVALKGLPMALLELTLEQLEKTNNFNAAFWFSQQIVDLQNPS